VQGSDIDGDGNYDYILYTYVPVDSKETGMIIQRQVAVAVYETGTFTSLNTNLNDLDYLLADQKLAEFSKSKTQADTECSTNLGVLNLVCSDVNTCSKLCSGASTKCKGIAEKYDETLAGSMMSYVQKNNEIHSALVDARRRVFTLDEASEEDVTEFLEILLSIKGDVAEINSNPVYNQPDLTLCSHSDYGTEYLVEAANIIGDYESRPSKYHYTVMISVKPKQKIEDIGAEIGGVTIKDNFAKSNFVDTDQISSIQDISATRGTDITVEWSSPKPSKNGYLLIYEFVSTESPDSFVSTKTPELNVRTINLSGLLFTNMLLVSLNGIIGNYYLALGAAFGITIALLFLLYSVMVVVFTVINEKIAGKKTTSAFRKVFGRTEVRWKTDMGIGLLLVSAGVYISLFMAKNPSVAPPLMESVDFLLKNDMGIVGTGLFMIGLVTLYLAIENLVKITILERTYGMVIKQEKEVLILKGEVIKQRINELKKLIDEYNKQGFETGTEQDIIVSIRPQEIDKSVQANTVQTRNLLDEELMKIENAIGDLKERKKVADENWIKWKDSIAKILSEQNEVYTTSIITIPSSLRIWALKKYIEEVGSDGLSFERDSIKKTKKTPGMVVSNLLHQGLLKGVVVMRNGNEEIVEFAEGNATVMKVLAIKLRNYVYSLAKNLGQHEPQTFASLGTRDVILFIRAKNVESVVIIPKDKFKEAVTEWKEKLKKLDST